MKIGLDSQVQFFLALKNAIPSYSSLVDEVAETINISLDSAYRRIRGEKLLNYNELFLLCQKFNISIDKIFSDDTSSVLFQTNQNNLEKSNFLSWMQDVLHQLEMVNTFSKKHIYFLLKDMPPWYHYYHKELSAFKFFFWKKSILFSPDVADATFSMEEHSYPEFEEISKKIIRAYNHVNSTEIWNLEGINTTLHQINLYHEMGIITDPKLTIRLYSCLFEVINHLEKMAEQGKKFTLGGQPNEESANYYFYVNEFVLGDNTFFVELDNKKITYLNYNVIYFMGTSDVAFNKSMFRNLENLIKKSTQISVVGEKERRQFFNKLRKNIRGYLEAISINEE